MQQISVSPSTGLSKSPSVVDSCKWTLIAYVVAAFIKSNQRIKSLRKSFSHFPPWKLIASYVNFENTSSMKTITKSLAPNLKRNRAAVQNNGIHHRLIQTNSKADEKYRYEDAALKWGRRNPTKATACMQPPPMPKSSDFLHRQMEAEFSINSWSDYWKWRKWDFSPASKDAGDEDSSQDDGWRHSQALTTHVLTAPVTVAYLLFQQSKQNDTLFHHQQENPSFTLRCCCLGARSESMLPVEYWRELLLLWHYYYFQHNIHSICIPSVRIILDFVGPDLVMRPPATLTYEDKATLVLRWMFKGKFHDWLHQDQQNEFTSSKEDHKMDYDAYILLNPGIGHPHLQAEWKPTLDLLLLSSSSSSSSPPNDENSIHQRTRYLVWTAHSKLDADRDMDRLRAYTRASSAACLPCDGDDSFYLENPFSSRITYQDPFDTTHLVRPNHYCHHTTLQHLQLR